MAWIESHQTLSKHRKTLLTAGRLSVDRHTLIGHLMELWWWGLDNVPSDGYMGNVTYLEISMAAEWRGDPEEFVNALIECGFIDEKPDGLWLHDWFDYAGKLLVKREKEKERSKTRRSTSVKTTKRPQVDQRTTEEKPTKVARHSNSNSNRITTTTKEVDVVRGQDDQSHDKHMESPSNLEQEMAEEDYCKQIQGYMIAEGANSNYFLQGDSYKNAQSFFASDVPISFVKNGISAVFERERNKGKRVTNFAYCAGYIEDLWLRELASREQPKIIEYSVSVAATKETKKGEAKDGHNVQRSESSDYGEAVRNTFYGGWKT